MSIQLNHLPSEIITLVSLYSAKRDLLNALLVSKSWYNAFNSYIYTSINFTTAEKLQQVIKCFKQQQLPGHLVRELVLQQHCQLTEQDMEDLAYLFPEIHHLRLDWSIWPSHLCFADHFDTKAPISFIHPPQGLPPSLSSFFYSVGPNLKSLSINAQNQQLTDIWSILGSCPSLRKLELLNLGYEHIITLGYIETIHQLCPQLISLKIKCVRSDPNPALVPQFQNHQQKIVIHPVSLQYFSLSSVSGSAKWPLWLPYFAVKYPHIEHIMFKHTGLGRDGHTVQAPDSVYTLFNEHCTHVKSIRWHKIVVQDDQQELLFSQPKRKLQRIEAYEDFMIPNSLLNSPIVQKQSPMSRLLTSLTLGQPPASVSTTEILTAIGECPNLLHLKIQECFSNQDVTYAMDDILNHCRNLTSLVLKDVHMSCHTTNTDNCSSNHPLKTLVMKRASFTHDVFPVLSQQCPQLNHVELIGCVQTDRRDQVQINLSRQHLSTLIIHGLRTRRYYVGCRIRFFAVNSVWYYMTGFDVRPHPIGHKRAYRMFRNMEYAQSFERLDDRDIQELSSLVTTETLKGWDIESVKSHLKQPFTKAIDPSGWNPENIYYSGLVQITCQSVQNLFINDKRITQ